MREGPQLRNLYDLFDGRSLTATPSIPFTSLLYGASNSHESFCFVPAYHELTLPPCPQPILLFNSTASPATTPWAKLPSALSTNSPCLWPTTNSSPSSAPPAPANPRS